MKQKLLKTWLMLCLLVIGAGNVWAQVATETAKNNGNYVVAVYSGGKYYALPHVSTTAGTFDGTVVTLNKDGKVNTEDAANLSWTLTGSGTQYTMSFKSGSVTYYLYKNGTSNSTNYNIKTVSNDEHTWTFTKSSDGKTYSVKSDRGSAATILQYESSNWKVIGTSASYSIILLPIGDVSDGGDSGDGGGSGDSGGSGDGGGSGPQDGTSITITAGSVSNFAAEYNTYNWTANDVSGKMYAYRGGSVGSYNMQFNKNTAIYNTTAVPGKIKSIKMTKVSGTDRAWSVYVSSSPLTTKGGTNLNSTAQTVNTEGYTWDVTSGDYSYFYITKADGGTNIGEIVITYDNTPSAPVQIPDFIKKTSDNAKVTDVIDLSEYVNKPNDYTGDISYTVTSGADKCDIADETLEITKAGEIIVKVSAAAAGNYLLTEGTITFTAAKNELGEFLKQANISLVKNDTKAMSELLTLGNYDGTISYDSDKSSVADVDEGELLAYAIGSANITITASDTEAWTGGTKTLAVTVSGKAPTILTENKTYTLIKDGTAAATTVVADDGLTVKFRSGNEDVARVDDAGVITAVAPGKTTIYAYTEANDDFAAGEEVYATVAVVEPVITFTPEAGSFAADNTPVKVNVTGVEDYIYTTDNNVADNFDLGTDGVEAGDAETTINISATTTIRVKAIDKEFNLSPIVSATFTRKQQPNIQIAGIENGSSKNITWGDEFEMPTVTAADGAVLNYKSSAYSVATFESSTLNILKAGTTTITVSVKEDENFVGEQYSFTLVIAKATPTVTFASTDNQEIFIDDTEAKAYEYVCNTPGLTVSYSSSNTNVVEVNAETGALTPVKAGTAIIYAKTPGNQDNYYQGAAQYKITVKKHDATLAWNDGEGTNVNYEIGETEFAGWTATTNSNNPVTYKSSAVSVATVDENTGAVTVVGKGTTTITASVAASDTYNAATSISYTITASNGIMYFHEIASVNDIVEGAKYVIVQPNSQKATTTISSKKLLSTSVTIDNSTITLDDVNTSGKPYVVQFEKNGESWLIKASYGYIVYGGSSTDIASNATLPTTVPNTYKWKITMDDDGIKIQSVSATTRYLMFNSSNELRPFVPSGTTYSYPALYAQTASTINISEFQNTTLSLKTPYVMPTGLVGKTVSAKEGSAGEYTLTLTTMYNEGDVVPAGEALVVQGAQGTYTALAGTTTAAKTAYPENLLVAEYTPQDTKFLTSFNSENSADYYYYKLTTKDGANFGWYYGAADGAPFLMSSKERAYLVIEKEVASLVKGFTLDSMTEGEATAIDMVDASKNENTRIYDLQGRRVQKATRGLYIVNGKKVMFK